MSAIEKLRILMLEDLDSDADLIEHALRKNGLEFEARRESGRAGFEQALAEFAPDVILADFNLPDYTGTAALRLAKERLPDVPVIMVTGNLGDEAAVDLIKAGARDYVLKDRLARLGPAVRQALDDSRERQWRIRQEAARRQSEHKFKDMLDNVQLAAVILDPKGAITYANAFLLELAGWTASQVIGGNWMELFIPEDSRDEMRRVHQEVVAGKEAARHHENAIVTRTGEHRLIRWDNTLLRGPDGAVAGVASLGADITDYRRASEDLRAREQRFRALIENISDVIGIVDPQGIIRYISPNSLELTGRQAGELIGRPFDEFVHPDDRDKVQRTFKTLMANPAAAVRDTVRIRKSDGTAVTTSAVTVNRIAVPGIGGLVFAQHDVTPIENALAETRRAQQLLESIVNAIPVRVFWKDRELRYRGCNQTFAEDAGYADPADVIGQDDYAMPWKEQAELYRAADLTVIESNEPNLLMEEPQTAPDGQTLTLLTSKVPLRDNSGQAVGMIGTYMDITEHKQLQAHLQLAETLIERSPAVLFRWQAREGWPVDYVTDNVSQWGYAAEALLAGDPPFSALVHPDDLARVASEIEQHVEAGETEFAQEYRIVTRDGCNIWVDDRTTVERGEDGAPIYFQGIVTDISARKDHEESLQRANRALRVLSSGNAALARAQSEEELLSEMCQLIIDIGAFQLAWVGYAEHDEQSSVRPVASAGLQHTVRYIQDLNISWADVPEGRGPTGRCIRESCVQLINDTQIDGSYAPWRARAAEYGLRSSIALPLKGAYGTLGALNIYAANPAAFTESEINLLTELAGELSYGIQAQRTRADNAAGQQRLAASLEATVRVLAGTVEMRDPYTSGHQQRVADLSVAIGRALGLSEFQLKGLSLAASIHDIGKLRVPAEILSNPGKLTAIEYELIKGHPGAALELLAGIELPWPIAEIVGQHHERLDGSGYPNGLKGSEILLEAKIIAVADVVEAMSTHRPYRPALGQEEALKEIRRGRGTQFDAAIVDACLRLLENGEFEFNSTSASIG